MKSKLLLIMLAAMAIGAGFSVDPSKWKEPRYFHVAETDESNGKIRIRKSAWPAVLIQPVHSPNKSYYYMVLRPDTTQPPPLTTKLYLYNEGTQLIEIDMIDHYPNFAPKIEWINEKLVFIRIWWGRVIGTDLIFDVEKESVIYQEAVHDGRNLFEQYQDSMKAIDAKP